MLDYLHSAGYHKTFEQFKEEAEQSEYDPDPNSKTSDLLVKKWTSVIRLQKKVRAVTVSTGAGAAGHRQHRSQPRERERQKQKEREAAEAAALKKREEEERAAAAQASSSKKSRNSGSQSRSSSDTKRGPPPENLRVWHDRTGQFRVDAAFLGYSNGKLRLHKVNAHEAEGGIRIPEVG
ncbi:hypothetical protein NUW54_g2940 [Trametes sanguinea]|uniref:Uncharacterized protein n=1 Tax=Trametes sanguinea TaxID=158606 RepID=A0ACC1Q5T8_9APHY|nr:hypothetical protein NUW54_g2940 [Trametes sanguinea]